MAKNTNTLTRQCRILKEYVSDGDCIRLIECDGKLFWHITSHGEVKICEEVEGGCYEEVITFNISQPEEYIVEIFQGNQCVNREKTIVPPEIMQAQFMQMCVQLKQSGQPMKIRLTRFEWVEGRTEPLELYLEYQTWRDD